MLFTYAVIALVTFALINFIRKLLKLRAAYFKLPNITDYRYKTGSLHKFPGRNEEGMAFHLEAVKKFIYCHVFWFGPIEPVVIVYHPDVLRPIIKSSAPKPRNRLMATASDMALRWLGEGVLLANGAKWTRSRRLITPAFHFDILKEYVAIYNKCGDLLIDKMKAKAKSKTSIDLYTTLGLDALDIILQCAFSYTSSCQSNGQSSATDYAVAVRKLQALWAARIQKPQYFIEFLYSLSKEGKEFYKLCDFVHKVAEEIIEKRKRELDANPELVSQKKVTDFLDTLLIAKDENGQGLSPLEIRNEVDTFMFEGHDTTASAMTWVLYCLAQHPEYQERVYEEVMEVLQGREYVEWSDLPKLEFTTMCIKEGMRLHSPVPSVDRRLTEDCNIHGHTIPAGSRITVMIYALHRNPHVWDDPLEFKPERFHPDKQIHMDPFQYLPFLAGTRNCIGQNFAMNEMKVTISRVIKNFKLTVDTTQTARRVNTITMKPEKGAYVYAAIR